jgi:hypothetical protein
LWAFWKIEWDLDRTSDLRIELDVERLSSDQDLHFTSLHVTSLHLTWLYLTSSSRLFQFPIILLPISHFLFPLSHFLFPLWPSFWF